MEDRIIEVSCPWAKFIFDGIKKVEMRKNTPTWNTIKTGDRLKIIEKGTENCFVVLVEEIRTYLSIEECLESEGVRNLLPGLKRVKEGLDVYLGFDGLEKVEERRKEFELYGCIVFQLKKLYPYVKPSEKVITPFIGNDIKTCLHEIDGISKIEYNDDTMGGCGSGWDSRCNLCGKVWYD